MQEPLTMRVRLWVVLMQAGLLVLLWVLGFQSYQQGRVAISVMCGVMMVIVAKKMLNVLFEKTSSIDRHSPGYS